MYLLFHPSQFSKLEHITFILSIRFIVFFYAAVSSDFSLMLLLLAAEP